MLRKIKHYNDLAAIAWRLEDRSAAFADDEKWIMWITAKTLYDDGYHLSRLTAKKVYCGAYPMVNTSSGTVNHGANADLMRCLRRRRFGHSLHGSWRREGPDRRECVHQCRHQRR